MKLEFKRSFESWLCCQTQTTKVSWELVCWLLVIYRFSTTLAVKVRWKSTSGCIFFLMFLCCEILPVHLKKKQLLLYTSSVSALFGLGIEHWSCSSHISFLSRSWSNEVDLYGTNSAPLYCTCTSGVLLLSCVPRRFPTTGHAQPHGKSHAALMCTSSDTLPRLKIS